MSLLSSARPTLWRVERRNHNRHLSSRIVTVVFFLVTLSVLFASQLRAQVHEWNDRYANRNWRLTEVQDEVIVLFKREAGDADRDAAVSAEGLVELRGEYARLGVGAFRTPAGSSSAAIAARIQGNVLVEAAVPAVVDQDGFRRYYIPNRLTIQFDQTVPEQTACNMIAAMGSNVVADYWTPGFYQVGLSEGADLFQSIRDWYTNPAVLFAEPTWLEHDVLDYIPQDSLFADQWALRNTGQEGGEAEADVQASGAWDITKGNPNIILAIVDSGMHMSHEDLQANLLNRGNEDWDFFCAACNPICYDCEFYSCDDQGDVDPLIPDETLGAVPPTAGHGTKVAGIAAAVEGNGDGISGMAPLCRLMPLRVNMVDPFFELNGAADAINLAASKHTGDKRVVINLSWHSGLNTCIEMAINSATSGGCAVTVAAGNTGGGLNWPATMPNVFAVGMTDRFDERHSASSFGAELDFVAPGVDVKTTKWPGSAPLGLLYSTQNPLIVGTSFASPLVAGVCALVWSVNPGYSYGQVYTIIAGSAEDLVGGPSEDVPGRDDKFGHGRVNAYRAVQIASKFPLIDVTRRDLSDSLAGTKNGQGVAWGDYDDDGDLDLYITNYQGENSLLRNEGAEQFTNVTTAPLDDNGYGICAAWGDYDNDGDLDLYLVNDSSPNRLFRNDGNGNFVDAGIGETTTLSYDRPFRDAAVPRPAAPSPLSHHV